MRHPKSHKNAEASEIYGDSWYAATMVDAPRRPALYSDLDIDVCVIGGGLAGLTTARELARKGWSVVLLEAGRLAANASGRNTGFVLPGFGADADKLIARVGFERTKDLWTLAQAGLDYVRDTIETEKPAGVDAQDGWLYVSKQDNSDEFVKYVALLGELGCDIESWPTERVREVLRSERYFYAINYLRALAIHPLNYALALAAAAERDGARIFENTPALSIDPSGVRKRIVTPGARLRANHVVLCGNIGLKSLMPRLAATMVPLTTYVITTAPLGDRLAQTVRYRGGVSDTDAADNHYRVVGGDRLMLSGRATTWSLNPRRYVRTLTADIEKTYPQLGEVEIDYAWAGTLGITVHRMPQIGELGPGVWLASGFGGHGLNTTAMGGNLIVRAIVDGDQTWRQFTPFELVWAGGVVGRAAAQIRVWVKRLRAAVEERRAKARESAHWQAQLNAVELTLQPERAAPFERPVPDQIDGAGEAAPARPNPAETADTTLAQTASAPEASAETIDSSGEPSAPQREAPRAAGRRRKRTRPSPSRAIEHDAEA
ncbi:MAG: FAD-dependent oxidoreductase [Xanthobacteraceae bacterium]